MRAAVGGFALGSPRIWESLTKPASGSVLMELLQLVPEVPRKQKETVRHAGKFLHSLYRRVGGRCGRVVTGAAYPLSTGV
jgi:hypothetical protein